MLAKSTENQIRRLIEGDELKHPRVDPIGPVVRVPDSKEFQVALYARFAGTKQEMDALVRDFKINKSLVLRFIGDFAISESGKEYDRCLALVRATEDSEVAAEEPR